MYFSGESLDVRRCEIHSTVASSFYSDSWRGGRESQALLRVVDVNLVATPSPYHSGPLDIWRFCLFVCFCQSSMSAWEVLAGDAENKTACHQELLGKCWDDACVPSTKQCSDTQQTWTECPTNGSGSSTHPWGAASQVCRVRGSGPRDCPFQMPLTSPGCHLCFISWGQIEISTLLPGVWLF